MTSQKSPSQPTDECRILFLEDEVILALTFVDTLERLDLGEVVQATDIQSAMEAIDAQAINIAVLDVNVAGETSFGVAEKVLAQGGKVIFATGYSFDASLFDAYECKVIRKPYEEEELKEAVLAACKSLRAVA